MIAVVFAERPADQRRCHDGEIDRDIVELERVVNARISRRIQRAHLHGEVAFETTCTNQQKQKSDQEIGLGGHQEVAGGHQACPQRDGPCTTQRSIGEKTARDRRYINESRIQAENHRCQCLRRQRSIDPLQRSTKSDEADDMLDVTRQQQAMGHVKHQQSLHAVIRKALPELGCAQPPKSAWVTEKRVLSAPRLTGLGLDRIEQFNAIGHLVSPPWMTVAVVLQSLLVRTEGKKERSPALADKRLVDFRCPVIGVRDSGLTVPGS